MPASDGSGLQRDLVRLVDLFASFAPNLRSTGTSLPTSLRRGSLEVLGAVKILGAGPSRLSVLWLKAAEEGGPKVPNEWDLSPYGFRTFSQD
jgi:hypothetical protein